MSTQCEFGWCCDHTSCPWETKNEYTNNNPCDPRCLRYHDCIFQLGDFGAIINRFLVLLVNPCRQVVPVNGEARIVVTVVRKFPSDDLRNRCATDTVNFEVRLVNLSGIVITSWSDSITGEGEKEHVFVYEPPYAGEYRLFVELWVKNYLGQTACIDRQEIIVQCIGV